MHMQQQLLLYSFGHMLCKINKLLGLFNTQVGRGTIPRFRRGLAGFMQQNSCCAVFFMPLACSRVTMSVRSDRQA